MDEVLKEFLTESREGLDQLDTDFIDLEQNPDDRDKLASIFRTIHTIKGTCGFLGFTTLEGVTHVGENLLVKLRDGDYRLNTELTSALLEMVDAVRSLLSHIEQTGNDHGGDYSDLIRKLEYFKDNGGQSAPALGDDKAIDVTENTSLEAIESQATTEDKASKEPAAAISTKAVEVDDEMAQVIKEFLEESAEGLDRLDNELVELEEHPADRDILSSIFRTIHTIKGTCGFLGYEKLERVTHIGENLLAKLRDGELTMTEEIANALLTMVDAVRAMLSEIELNYHDGNEDYHALIEALTRLKDDGMLGSASLPPPPPSEQPRDVSAAGVVDDKQISDGKKAQPPSPATQAAPAESEKIS